MLLDASAEQAIQVFRYSIPPACPRNDRREGIHHAGSSAGCFVRSFVSVFTGTYSCQSFVLYLPCALQL